MKKIDRFDPRGRGSLKRCVQQVALERGLELGRSRVVYALPAHVDTGSITREHYGPNALLLKVPKVVRYAKPRHVRHHRPPMLTPTYNNRHPFYPQRRGGLAW